MEGDGREFLPPQAPGPEPEVGARPEPGWQPPAEATPTWGYAPQPIGTRPEPGTRQNVLLTAATDVSP